MDQPSHIDVEEYYDELSSGYDELYGEEQSKKHEQVRQALARKSFEILVDVGCATGKFLATTGEHCRMGIGIDISSPMLQKAKTALRSDKVAFVRASAANLPIRSECADGAVSISVLDYNKSSWQLEALELHRITKPQGAIAVTIFHDETGSPRLEELGFSRQPRAKSISRRETLYLTS